MSRLKMRWGILFVAGFAAVWGVTGGPRAGAVPPETSPSPQYAIAIYETPAEFALRTDMSERGGAYWRSWGGYREALQQAGVLRGGMPLQPAKVVRQVRLRDGKPAVTPRPTEPDGPQLSGFFLIEVESLDQAIDWAPKAPNAATNVVEVWPAFPVAMPPAS